MAAGQIYAMTMCDYHVISLVSGFGRVAPAISKHWHNVFQIDQKNRSCTPTTADSLEVLADSGAGLR